jgi:hypothetical protein
MTCGSVGFISVKKKVGRGFRALFAAAEHRAGLGEGWLFSGDGTDVMGVT